MNTTDIKNRFSIKTVRELYEEGTTELNVVNVDTLYSYIGQQEELKVEIDLLKSENKDLEESLNQALFVTGGE